MHTLPRIALVLWIVLVSGCFAQNITYENLPIGTPVTKTNLLPCQYVSFQVNTTQYNAINYILHVTVTSLNNTDLGTEVSSAKILDFEYSGFVYRDSGSDVEIEVICTYTLSSIWYITVTSFDDPSDFTIEVTVPEITIFALPTNGSVVANVPVNHSADSYQTKYDFYSFSFADTVRDGQTLQITVSNSASRILLAHGHLPENTFTNNCFDASTGSNTLTVDYCTLSNLVALSSSNNYYVAVQLNTNILVNYNISVSLPYPEPTPLTIGSTTTVTYTLQDVGQVNYYSLAVSDPSDEIVNITIVNIKGGSVDFAYEFGQLPFISCLNQACNSYSCCNNINTACQLVIQPCNVQSGTYYIAVKANDFLYTYDTPITYEIRTSITSLPSAAELNEGNFLSTTISQAQYNHYKFDEDGFKPGDNTLLTFHLYVDQAQAETSVSTTMYVNYEGFAGSGSSNSCWDNIATCTVFGVGSCSIQINPCEFKLYDDWYVSIFAGTAPIFYGTSTAYTLIAELVNPVILDTSYLVIDSTLDSKQYDHYQLANKLLPTGRRLNFVVFDVFGNDLTVYKHFGGLAGNNQNICPKCYNFTDVASATPTTPLVWVIANCNNNQVAKNPNDIYFSVYNNGPATSGYSLTIVFDDDDDSSDISKDLSQAQVLVGSVDPKDTDSYSVRASQGSQSYLQIILTTVEYQGSNSLKLTIANTTYLNCVPENSEQMVEYRTFRTECQPNDSGSCSIVLQTCNYNISSGWIAQVHNSDDSTTIHYNLYYNIYSSTPKKLSNLSPVASSVQQHIYDQYSYSASGADTLIVEVFFDDGCQDANQNSCIGGLFVSDIGPTGDPQVTDCVKNVFFSGKTSSATNRVVWTASSCALEAKTYYFAVGTESDLNPQFPLKYTIKVTEMSYSVTTPTNTPISQQIYPGQKIYHTFTPPTDLASTGVVYSVSVTNVQPSQSSVSPVLALNPPPNNTCPCFEYQSSLEIDYCNAASNTASPWTVLVQGTGPSYELIGYTITIEQFSMQPVALNLSTTSVPVTPTSAAVKQGQYYYIQLSSSINNNQQILLSLNNIDGGSLEVYWSNENPATANCNDGSLPTCNEESCIYQIGACFATPRFISVRGASATSFDPITFDVSLSQISPLDVSQGSQSSTIPASLSQYFSYQIPDFGSLTSPQISFTITSGNSSFAPMYTLNVYADSLCSNPINTNPVSESGNFTYELSNCNLGSGTFFLLVRSTYAQAFTLTVSASSTDLTAGATQVFEGTTSVPANSQTWTSVYFTVDDSSMLRSLSYDADNVNQFYFGFSKVSPGCYDSNDSDDSVNSCCLQAGNYYFLFKGNNNTDITINLTPIATGITEVNSGSIDTTESVLEETKSIRTTGNYVARYSSVELLNSNDRFDAYWEKINRAGPSQGNSNYCLSSFDRDTNARGITFINQLQCNYVNDDTISQPYDIGTLVTAVETDDNSTVSIKSGASSYNFLSTDPLSVPALNSIPIYFSYSSNIQDVSVTKQISFTLTSNSSLEANLYSDSACGQIIASCDDEDIPCILVVNSCAFAEQYIISATTDSDASVTAVVQVATITDWTPVSLTPNTAYSVNSTSSYFTLDIGSNLNETGYFQLTITNYDANPNTIQTSYSIDNRPVCFQPANNEWDCDDNNVCVLTFDTCQILANSTYVFSISTSDPVYEITYSGLQNAVSTPITVGTPVVNSIRKSERQYYVFNIDETFLPGQDFSISVEEKCGSVSVYVSQESVPGPSCDAALSETTITSCLAALVSPLGTTYVTVVGDSEDYSGVPARYELTITLGGAPQTFIPIGENQVFNNTVADAIYVFPVAGIDDFIGQLVISLSLESLVGEPIPPNTQAQLNVYFDSYPDCGNPALQLSVTNNNIRQLQYVSACTLDAIRLIYVTFSANSAASANFELTRARPYVRDLNFYTDIPQEGAVVPHSSFNGYVDEEYYSIQFDSSVPFFQFSAWLEFDTVVANNMCVYVSQEQPPSSCFGSNNNIYSACGSNKLIVDYCQLDPDRVTYITVSYPSNMALSAPVSYELYYSLTLENNPVALTQNTPYCAIAEANSWNFYTFTVDISGNSYLTVSLYSINAEDDDDCTLNAYLNNDNGGLATDSCSPSSWDRTCSSPTCGSGSTTCTWTIRCAFSGNFSIGVENSGTTEIDYYVVYNLVTVPVTPLVVNNGSLSQGVYSIAETFYYSVSTVTLQNNQYLSLSIINTDGNQVQVYYQQDNLPGDSCQTLVTCSDECSSLLYPCSYEADKTIYISVATTGVFEISVAVVNTTLSSLSMNSYVENSFTLSSNQYFTYQLNINNTAGPFQSDVTVSIYGVNQGTITAWISVDEIGGPDCSIANGVLGPNPKQINFVIPRCTLSSDSTYYVTLSASNFNNPSCNNEIQFGVAAFWAALDGTYVTLASGTPVENVVPYSSNPRTDFYSFSPNSPITSVVITSSNEAVDIDAALYSSNSCSLSLDTPIYYLLWCNTKPEPIQIIVDTSVPVDLSGLPSANYTITVKNEEITDLDTVNATAEFPQTTYDLTNYYQFTLAENSSALFDLYVSSGPAVTLSLINSCSLDGSNVATSVTCYFGHCYIPISWNDGDLRNPSTPYYISVTGSYPSKYSLTKLQGEQQTCVAPTNTELCDITWSVWNYGSGESGFVAQNSAALRLYNLLVEKFVPSCEKISDACNSSLIEYACTSTYRACDYDGFQASICALSCQNVESDCGSTFTQVGLPWLSCNHNFYLGVDDEICVDIYGVSEDNSNNRLLWLIVLIVIFFVLLILLAVAGYFIYKKYKATRQNGPYESIPDVIQSEDE